LTPIIVDGVASLADRFDVFLIDQYGVLHDGVGPYPGVVDALRLLQRAGKQVVLITNSGKRAKYNSDRLARLGITQAMYSALVTSGEIAWRLLKARTDAWFASLGSRCLLIAGDPDPNLLDGLDLVPATTARDADFILIAGRPALMTDTEWRAVEQEGIARNLPLICSNPDTSSIVGGKRWMTGPGELAKSYERAGGQVCMIGKPYRRIFDEALVLVGITDRGRTLMVGDSLASDIRGGVDAGLATLLIASGAHRQQLSTSSGRIDRVRASMLFEEYNVAPTFVSEAI
jgi:HAD superfamily hydrolase (TIGR01459 family)